MPLIDVSDLLEDPDFTTVIEVIRVTEGVDSHGMSARSEDSLGSLSAVVTPISGQRLVQLADGSQMNEFITVYSLTRMRAATDANPADIVVWRGERFLVKTSEDWSEYGRGFYVATCELWGVNPT